MIQETVLQAVDPWNEEVDRVRKELDIENKTLAYHVERGKLGLNKGFDNGMNVLNKYLYGTHRGRYYLIGADSGVGKTTLADFMYAYNLYKACEAVGVPLEMLYFSFEISVVMKKAKWASMLYYIKYGEYLTMETILGYRNRLTDDQDAKLATVTTEIEAIFSRIQFIEATVNPYRMFDIMQHRAGAYGDHIKDKGLNGPSSFVGYKNNRPDVVKVTIVDHLALMDEVGGGRGLKYTMDLASGLFVKARNLWDETIVVVQQFNTDLQVAAREKKSPAAYVPTRQDLGDSRYTYRDADVVLGLTRPIDYQLTEVGKYKKLTEWGQYFVKLHIMKNRYGGGTGNFVPLFQNYVTGIPEELPSEAVWDANTLLQAQILQRAKDLDALGR